MDKKYGEFVGVDNLHFAKVLQDDANAYVAETPRYLAPAAEVAAETETNNTPTYYDNIPGFNYVSEGITTLTITVSGVPGRLAAELLGKDFDVASGRVLDSGIPVPPDIACGYRAGVGKEDYRYTWYLKGTFSGGAEEAATKTNDVDIRTYQLTYTAIVTTKQWLINGKTKGLKKVSGDTTEPSFDPSGFFAQVQTPDTSAPPAALTLVSSSPVEGGTAAVTDNVTLTFSTRIAIENVLVINTTSGGVVAGAKTWNAAGTILTFTPAADLAAGADYMITVVGVVDVYGQSLASTTITFETA